MVLSMHSTLAMLLFIYLFILAMPNLLESALVQPMFFFAFGDASFWSQP
jgi:S-adenosylmethionine:tRNA-ribosyltransferase-isomerase (queuine synthetase)